MYIYIYIYIYILWIHLLGGMHIQVWSQIWWAVAVLLGAALSASARWPVRAAASRRHGASTVSRLCSLDSVGPSVVEKNHRGFHGFIMIYWVFFCFRSGMHLIFWTFCWFCCVLWFLGFVGCSMQIAGYDALELNFDQVEPRVPNALILPEEREGSVTPGSTLMWMLNCKICGRKRS